MIIFFGWGHRTLKKYGVLKNKNCSQCSLIGDIELIKVTIWFTVFFIPVIPYAKRYLLMCTACKGIEEVDKEAFFEYVENESIDNYENMVSEHKVYNKTITQLNYLKEMEDLRKEKEVQKAKHDEKRNQEKKSKEALLIQNSKFPITKEYLIEQLKTMGIKEGMNIMVHSSLSSLGWVCGGAVTVIEALKEVVTSKGTLIMPTHSGDWSDPKLWEKPPVPEEWKTIIRDTMPAYDKYVTPTRGMGKIPELFRTMPDVIRSNHPQVSFSAWGSKAKEITSEHPLNNSLSYTSPLGRLYDIDDTYILLLGVAYDNNTIFHLAEYDLPNIGKQILGSPIIKDGVRIWAEYEDIEYDCSDFNAIGALFEKENNVVTKSIGLNQSKLFNAKEAVDYAKKWMKENRR